MKFLIFMFVLFYTNHIINADVKDIIINKHNTLRFSVKPPAIDMKILKWDNTLETRARKVASSCTLEHQDTHNIGQNIYIAYNKRSRWYIVLNSWFSENKRYDYVSNSQNGTTGHYKQLVWAETSKIGCAYARCPNAKYVYVCNYYPPGNYNNRRPYKTYKKYLRINQKARKSSSDINTSTAAIINSMDKRLNEIIKQLQIVIDYLINNRNTNTNTNTNTNMDPDLDMIDTGAEPPVFMPRSTTTDMDPGSVLANQLPSGSATNINPETDIDDNSFDLMSGTI